MSFGLKVNNGFGKSHDREFMIKRVCKITLESYSNLMKASNILKILSKMDCLITFWK